MHLKLAGRPETPRERSRRVAKIVTIVGNVAKRSEIEEAIDFHDNTYWDQARRGHYWIRTKKQKAAVNRLARALQRLRAVLNQKDLLPTLRSDFPMNESDLEQWCRRVEQIKATKLLNRAHLDRAKRHAVESAAEFCECHGVKLDKSRNGKFCRIAEVFYRDGNAKLHHYCRQYVTQDPAWILSGQIPV
jgi:hypothetical protein